METIDRITLNGTTYQIQASKDGGGNNIEETYAKKSELIGRIDPNSDGTGIILGNSDTNKNEGSHSVVEGKYNQNYGIYSHIEGGMRTNIYLTGNAGSTKYQISMGWLNTSLTPEELTDYFKQDHIQICNADGTLNDAIIISTEISDGKFYIILDKTLSDVETFTNKKLSIVRNVIVGMNSHLEGYANYIKAMVGHIEGNDNTIVSGSGSHIEGVLNFIKSKYTGNITGRQLDGGAIHVEGEYNIAYNPCEHVQGCYNLSHYGSTEADNTLHSIGWGVKGARKNIQEIMQNGDHYIIGLGNFDGTNYLEAKTVQQVIQEQQNIILQLQTALDSIQTKVIEPTETTLELSPNKFYKFGEVTNLTLTLGPEIKNIYNEYMFQFTSGGTPTTLSLPDTIKWIGDNTIEANKIYQVSIVNNMAVLGGVDNVYSPEIKIPEGLFSSVRTYDGAFEPLKGGSTNFKTYILANTIIEGEYEKYEDDFVIQLKVKDSGGYTPSESVGYHDKALLTDGIVYGNFYRFEGFDVLKGFTIIAIREYLIPYPFDSTFAFAYFKDSNGGPIAMEYSKGGKIYSQSFGEQTDVTDHFNPNLDCVFMTSKNYNGKTIAAGFPGFGNYGENPIFFGYSDSQISNLKFYAMEIYNRDLNDEEIQSVKSRMIKEFEIETGLKIEQK